MGIALKETCDKPVAFSGHLFRVVAIHDFVATPAEIFDIVISCHQIGEVQMLIFEKQEDVNERRSDIVD